MKDLRFTIYDLRLKLRIGAVCLLAGVIVTVVLKPALISTALAQTYKAWYSYAKLAQAGGDDLILICYDPNGTPATYVIGRDEFLAGRLPVTLTNGGIITGGGTGVLKALGVAANGQIPIGDGTTDPVLATITGTASEVDVNNAPGSITIGLVDPLAVAKGGTGAASLNNLIALGTHTTGNYAAGDAEAGGALSLKADESEDPNLTVLGKVHIRGDEDRLSAHLGAGGEIAGMASISFVKSMFFEFDPGLAYDSNSIVPLPKISSKTAPNGIIIDAWEVNCHLNPDVEMDMNLGYSANPNDMADPNLIDVLDTTNGQSSEDTDANINGGAAVPANVYLMLYFDDDPEGTCTALSVQIWYHIKAN